VSERRITHLAVAAGDAERSHALYVAMDDGTLWHSWWDGLSPPGVWRWAQVPMPPEASRRGPGK
jgi:hypothetical protein